MFCYVPPLVGGQSYVSFSKECVRGEEGEGNLQVPIDIYAMGNGEGQLLAAVPHNNNCIKRFSPPFLYVNRETYSTQVCSSIID